jgi:hypothetical protein
MPIAAEGLVASDVKVSAPQEEVASPERFRAPEWHSLRLFGRGRHPGTFDLGATLRDKL